MTYALLLVAGYLGLILAMSLIGDRILYGNWLWNAPKGPKK